MVVGRALDRAADQAVCDSQITLLYVSGWFAFAWIVLLALWGWKVMLACKQRQAACLLILLGTVPIFHLGDAMWQLWTYTHCECMVCRFVSFADYMGWLVAM